MTLTRIEFHVLLALVDGPRHGYGIMQDVERLTNGGLLLGPGTLYTAIRRLREAGFIDECAPDAARRRCYRLTPRGKKAAKDESERLSILIQAAYKRGLLHST